MTKIVDFGDIVVNCLNQDKNLQETAADLGAILLEMEREKQYYGEHTQRMKELEEMAGLQEKVVLMMLERGDGEPACSKRSRLRIVK